MTPQKQPERRTKAGWPRGRTVEAPARTEVRALLAERSRGADQLTEFLHLIQDRYGWISCAHLVALAEELGLSQAEVYEVATFYHHFDVVSPDETPPPPITVRVCDSITCALTGSIELARTLDNLAGEQVRVQRVSCVGRCDAAPVVVLGTNPIDKATGTTVRQRLADKVLSPELPPCVGYREYLTGGGYETLRRCNTGQLGRQVILDALRGAGLRGLGGAGFPTARKLEIVSSQPEPRFLVVNADEGEPGTFKDRFLLERNPHRFLEGMLIAAQVVGVEAVYIYLRDEYAAVRSLLQQELSALVGQPPCPLPAVYLRRGAGAYVCGEESAMLESIEGRRGMPRLRPPYVAESGLFARPTLVHNVETLYWVREILEKGPAWFAGQGRHGCKGLRSFSVSGRVNRPGVYVAPAGITARELVEEYAGGMLPDHELYAYFPGGASGGILPAGLADLPLDFGALDEHACFVGSGAVIVLSQHDRVRDAALNAMRFFARESCGKCTPCRSGTAKAVALMAKPQWNQALLEELASVMADASICGLGQAAPNPMLCALRYFPAEFADEAGS